MTITTKASGNTTFQMVALTAAKELLQLALVPAGSEEKELAELKKYFNHFTQVIDGKFVKITLEINVT